MRFQTNSKELSTVLSAVAKAISSKNVIPIMDNFLMVVADGSLTITGSDLETSIIAKMTVEQYDNGIAAIPAKVFVNALKEFKDEPITIEADEKLFGVKITSSNGEYEIVGDNPVDYPNTPIEADCKSIVFTKEALIDVVDKVSFAACMDEARPVMEGILFDNRGEDAISIVATDARTMAIKDMTGFEGKWQVVVPKHCLNTLKGLLGRNVNDVEISFNDRNVIFGMGAMKMICRLIDGAYPNYNSVVPKSNHLLVKIIKEDLLSAIKRVSMFGNDKYPVVRLEFKDKALTLRSQDIGRAMKASEQVPCEYDGEDITIGLNSIFMMNIINAISTPSLVITMSEATRPILVFPDGDDSIKYMLMPLLLS